MFMQGIDCSLIVTSIADFTLSLQAIQTPDYGSACIYLEAGISFLGKDHWSDSYNLILHLFKNAAFVHHESDIMMERLNEVFNNARNLDDKLDSLSVLIQQLSLDASNVSKASEKSFEVLEQLGESFPANPEPQTIAQELMEVKSMLEDYAPSSLSNIRPIEDPQKINAMVRSSPFIRNLINLHFELTHYFYCCRNSCLHCSFNCISRRAHFYLLLLVG